MRFILKGNKKGIVLLLILSLLLLFGIRAYESKQYKSQAELVNASVQADSSIEFVFEISSGISSLGGEDAMIVYPAENGEVFLPACADIKKIRVFFPEKKMGQVHYLTSGKRAKKQEIHSGEYFSLKTNNCTVEFTAEGLSGTPEREFTFYQGSTNSLFLTTDCGLGWLHESRENREGDADMLLLNVTGRIQYHAPLEELKSRGNTTWEQFDKKPYQIKLGEEADTGYSRNLFGMGRHKTWLLLALWQDEGYMATATTYELARQAGLLETSRLQFVDLYIDGEYRGLYALTEKVRVDEDGVDIRDLEQEYLEKDINPGGIAELEKQDDIFFNENGIYDYQFKEFELPETFDYSSGYLLELDDNWFWQEDCWFITGQDAPVVFTCPAAVNREQMQYVASLFQDLEDAIYSETGYNSNGGSIWDYADRDSWVKYFAIQEMMMNWDGYHSSTYFYVDAHEGEGNPKIYAGPLWDMDHSAMPQNLQNFTYEESLNYNTKFLAPALYGNQMFMEALSAGYGSIYPILQHLLAEDGWYDDKTEQISASACMDYVKWGNENALESTRKRLKENLLGHADWLAEEMQSVPAGRES